MDFDPVLDAIDSGDLDHVHRLVEAAPASAGARDASGVSAVAHAAYRGRRDIVEVLLHADPPLDLFDAALVGRADVVEASLAESPALAHEWSADGFTALHLAAFLGGAGVAGVLVHAGADVDAVARNPMQVRPLHSAVAARDTEVVRLLLDAGADPDVRQQGGWTPLQAAALHGQEGIVDLLLAAGADPSLAADDGRTAAAMAAEAGHADLAARLR